MSKNIVNFKYMIDDYTNTGLKDMNISKKELEEDKIKNILTERDLLLREIHHHVRNNMNTMISLLSIHIDRLKDPSAIKALQDAKSRMLCMKMLYDKLHCMEKLKEIPIKSYLSDLIEEIINIFPNRDKVKTKTEINDFVLESGVVSSVGLIINELITNIMKYAFFEKEEGLIKLSVTKNSNNITVILEDNGCGIPQSVDIGNSSGFGLNIVELLVNQIDGSMKIDRNHGTKFILEFEI